MYMNFYDKDNNIIERYPRTNWLTSTDIIANEIRLPNNAVKIGFKLQKHFVIYEIEILP